MRGSYGKQAKAMVIGKTSALQFVKEVRCKAEKHDEMNEGEVRLWGPGGIELEGSTTLVYAK